MRALIVDPEPLSRQRLRQLLPADLGIDVVGECSNGADALEAVRTEAPDLVFLDVQLPGMSGFDVLAALDPREQPLVVLTAVRDEFADRALEVRALDYLVKPIEPQRLRRSCERARDRLEAGAAAGPDATAPVTAPMRDRLVVRAGQTLVLLKTCELRWIEACGNYVRLHTTTGAHLVREKIGNLQNILDSGAFVRIHRSTIVNLEHVKSLRPWYSGELLVVMDDDTELKLSRTYRRELESRVHFLS